MDKLEKALEIRKNGANCSQTVLCTYASEMGLDYETAWRMSEGLGGGVGGRRGLCGAVNAMAMVLSYFASEGSASKGAHKKEVYALVNRAVELFKERNGSELCAVLKSHEVQEIKSCTDLILECVKIIEEFRNEESEWKKTV